MVGKPGPPSTDAGPGAGMGWMPPYRRGRLMDDSANGPLP